MHHSLRWTSLALITACGPDARREPVAPTPDGKIGESMGTMQSDAQPSPLPPLGAAVEASRPAAGSSPTPNRAPSETDTKIASLRARLRSCYSSALRLDPDLKTPNVSLKHTNGRITSVEIRCATLPPELKECITKAFVNREDLVEGSGTTTLGPACPPGRFE